MHNIRIELPDNKTVDCPVGIQIREFVKKNRIINNQDFLIAVKINNQTKSLASTINYNCKIEPVILESTDGLRIYRRSLSFLLEMASKEVFPSRRLKISHSIGNSYYYYFEENDDVPEKDIKALNKKMKDYVDNKYPINRVEVAYEEAVEMFREFNQPETLLLLEAMNTSSLILNSCSEFRALSYAPLVDNTDLLVFF